MAPSIAFTFGAWIALLSGIWFLFDKSESVASQDTKLRITRWLKNLDPGANVIQWPSLFAQTFDNVFGRRHLSIRCFLRSSLASLGGVAICFLVWAAFHSGELRSVISSATLLTVMVLVAMTVGINLVPDYVSLLETRYVLRLMALRPSARRTATLLVVDALATSAIAAAGFVLTLTLVALPWANPLVVVSRLVHEGLSSLIHMLVLGGYAYRVVSTVETFKAGGSETITTTVGVPGAIWFYAAFFTSVWVWLYALAGFTVKIAQGLGIGVTILRASLDIEKKPITSLGWVAMILSTILYWGAAILSRWWS